MSTTTEGAIEGTVREDGGALLRDGIKSLAKLGVCPEQRWPYKVSRGTFRKKPSRRLLYSREETPD